MAYSRQFPQNMTPKGTSVQAGFENDDKEIKRILDILSNTGALSLAGSKRQSVLYGPTDANGAPNFLTATGLSISIDGSSKPIIFAFANGFSPSTGSVDLIDKVDSLVSSAWTLPPNQTCYLYVDKNKSTGLLSFGYTASQDLYLSAIPVSPILDQHYFNTVEMKMYRYNSNSWEEKLRIFVGKAVTVTNTISLTQYMYTSKAPISCAVNGTADKAIADEDGNDIPKTYVKKGYGIGEISGKIFTDDFNNQTIGGFYRADTVLLNTPTGTPFTGNLLVFVGTSGYLSQIAMTEYGDTYRRSYAWDNKAWGSWKRFISAGVSLQGVNGYYALDDGTIEQWGIVGPFNSESTISFSYFVTMSAAYNAQATVRISSASGSNDVWAQIVGDPGVSSMQIQVQQSSGASTGYPVYVFWSVKGKI